MHRRRRIVYCLPLFAVLFIFLASSCTDQNSQKKTAGTPTKKGKLQFWETYKLGEIGQNIQMAENAFDAYLKNPNANDTTFIADTVATKKITGTNEEFFEEYSKTQAEPAKQKRSLGEFIQFAQQPEGGIIGYAEDTASVSRYLSAAALRKFFPRDLRFAFGIEEKNGKKRTGVYPLYALKTYGRNVSMLEGHIIKDAKQDFAQDADSKPVVLVEMTDRAAFEWAKITRKSAATRTPIAIVVNGIVISAPIAEGELGANSLISGNFTIDEAKELAEILKSN